MTSRRKTVHQATPPPFPFAVLQAKQYLVQNIELEKGGLLLVFYTKFFLGHSMKSGNTFLLKVSQNFLKLVVAAH